MRLVVCVDRDDDLGRKAGVPGPVVGREAILTAIGKLGTSDPEDADTNAMFAAVRLYDEISRTGDECEVVVLTGSPKVGILSDRMVGEQFDAVLHRIPATAAHLVSNGAEDEYLFPILASRIPIDGVHRVLVRQSASLESTYYTLVRALKDPKLRAKTVLPFALVMLTLGIAAAGGVLWWGVVGLLILLGIYLVFWTFDIDEAIIDSIRSASTDIRQGSVAFSFGIFAVALVGVGFLTGYNLYLANSGATPLGRILFFLEGGLIWWIFGALVWEAGRAIRRYIAGGKIPRALPVAATGIIGFGFVGYGILYLVSYLEGTATPAQLPLIIGAIVVGLAVVIIAGVLQQYFRSRDVVSGTATTLS